MDALPLFGRLVLGVQKAAMAPLVLATILAHEDGLDPELANAVLGVGIAISLLTVRLATGGCPPVESVGQALRGDAQQRQVPAPQYRA